MKRDASRWQCRQRIISGRCRSRLSKANLREDRKLTVDRGQVAEPLQSWLRSIRLVWEFPWETNPLIEQDPKYDAHFQKRRFWFERKELVNRAPILLMPVALMLFKIPPFCVIPESNFASVNPSRAGKWWSNENIWDFQILVRINFFNSKRKHPTVYISIYRFLIKIWSLHLSRQIITHILHKRGWFLGSQNHRL